MPVARYAPHRTSRLETARKIIIIRGRTPHRTQHHASRNAPGRELQRRKMTKLPIAASLLLTLAATMPAPQQTTSSTTASTKKKSSKKHHASKREPTQKAPTPERISEIQSALARNG